MNNDLEILKKINKVQVSPFLYTKIEQKINNLEPVLVSKLIYTSALTTLAVVLFINITFINLFYTQENKTETEVFVEELHISPQNSMYYE
jgi:hypothetical protein